MAAGSGGATKGTGGCAPALAAAAGAAGSGAAGAAAFEAGGAPAMGGGAAEAAATCVEEGSVPGTAEGACATAGIVIESNKAIAHSPPAHGTKSFRRLRQLVQGFEILNGFLCFIQLRKKRHTRRAAADQEPVAVGMNDCNKALFSQRERLGDAQLLLHGGAPNQATKTRGSAGSAGAERALAAASVLAPGVPVGAAAHSILRLVA